MLRFTGRSRWQLAAVVAIAGLSLAVASAAEVEGRGLLDSRVETLVGGNPGEGATNAKTVPLRALAGGIARDTTGNIFVTENQRILRLTPAGALSTIAGSAGTPGFRGDRQLALNALLEDPGLLTCDANGNVYVLDAGNDLIRKITAADGKIATVAGDGNNGNGTIADVGRLAVDARLNGGDLVGLAVDPSGNIYFADGATQVIYKVDAATGILSLVAGNGQTGQSVNGAAALGNPLNGIRGLAVFGSDLVYTEAGAVRRVNVSSDGKNVVIAGAVDANGNVIIGRACHFPDDGTRLAVQTDPTAPTIGPAGGVPDPQHVAVDGATVVFWDNATGRFRSFTPGATIQTVFGEKGEPTLGIGYRGDGIPAAPNTPRGGIAVRPGLSTNLDTTAAAPGPGGDDTWGTWDADLQLDVIETGANGVSETTAVGGDMQVTPLGNTSATDYLKRNDDPKATPCPSGLLGPRGALVVAGGIVTFVDLANELIRQFTIGGNVTTIAGAFQPFRFENTSAVAPIIVSALTATGQQGVAFTYTTVATNAPTSFNAAGLPAGLSMNTATGVISGTPTVNGVYRVTLWANGAGTGTATLTITLSPVTGAPVITSVLTATGTEGLAFAYNITATNMPASYGAAGLGGSGLVLDPATGAISGTPNNFTAGMWTINISATNPIGTGNAVLVLQINKAATAPVITSQLSATGTEGVLFSYSIVATSVPTWYDAWVLPAGLTVDNLTGVISGTPTVNGIFDLSIYAENATDGDTKNLHLVISPVAGAPVITSATVTTGYEGLPFLYQITATPAANTFGPGGAIGFGLNLDPATGLISGTPFGTGSMVVNLTADNAAGTGNGTLTIGIYPMPAGPALAGNANFSQLISDDAAVGGKGALIGDPRQLAKDGSGNIYFDAEDAYGHRKIYKYDAAAQTVSVVAGQVYKNGVVTKNGEGGPATAVFLSGLGAQVSVAADGSVLFAETDTTGAAIQPPHTISLVDAAGRITTVAGIPYVAGGSYPDGDRSTRQADGNPDPLLKREGQNATAIMLNNPEGVLGTSATDFAVADTGNDSVLVVAGGTVTKDINLGPFAPSFLAQPNATTLIVGSRAAGWGVPVIYSALTASAQEGQPFTYDILATDTPTGYTAAGLAGTGLAINGATGVISGTPITNGTFNITLGAVNGVGTGNATLVLTIAPLAGVPAISSALSVTTVQNAAMTNYQITATTASPLLAYSCLPAPDVTVAGLAAFEFAGAGIISGTPTVAGRFVFTIGAQNATGWGYATLVLNIDTATGMPQGTSNPAPTGIVGVPYSHTVTATNSPTAFAVAPWSALPAGLTLNGTTGLISGIPAVNGFFNTTIRITNATGTINYNVAITIRPGGGLRKIDLSGATPVTTPFGPTFGALSGICLATNGLFVAEADTITLLDAATGSPKYVARDADVGLLGPMGGAITGLCASGTTVRFATDAGLIREFTDDGATPPAAVTTKAGKFFTPGNLTGTGGTNLQVGFQFTNLTPLAAFGNGDQLVGDDGVLQFRRVVYGTVAPDATASTFAGSGNDSFLTGDGGPATSAVIGTTSGSVGGITVGSDNAVYFSDRILSLIRRVLGSGVIETVAGIPNRRGYSGTGLDAKATVLNSPGGVAFNAGGELYINDSYNDIVRKIGTDGKLADVAGAAQESGYEGDGYAVPAGKFNYPEGCAFDRNGDYFIADYYNGVVRVISSKGVLDTVAGNVNGGHDVSQDEAAALEAELGQVTNVTIDNGGKIYTVGPAKGWWLPEMATIIRTASGASRAVVGVGNVVGFNGDGLPGLQTLLDSPTAVLFEVNQGLVFTDSGNDRVRRLVNLAETTNTPPEAVIVATPDKLGQAPYKVRFDGSHSTDADGDIVTYEWDFGDGTKGNGAVVEHTYTAFGSYTVTLVVTDTAGQSASVTATVFAALPMIASNTNGKGAFKVSFSPKSASKPKDAFTISMKNVAGLSIQAGKSAKIYIGSFSIDAMVGGKGVKVTNKNVKLTIDPSEKKRTVAVAIKGVSLAAALSELGVKNENTVAPGKTVLIPVVVVVDNGALVVGDKFLFLYKAKYNSGASGKFSQ